MKLVALLGIVAIPVLAQVPPFNAAGVTMGHHHLMVPDVDAQKKIWVDVLGAEVSGKAPLEFLKFPGTFLILTQGKGEGGTEGSSVDSIAFAVRDYSGTRDRLARAGVGILSESATSPHIFTALFPDGIKVEFHEDKTLTVPVANYGIQLVSTDPGPLHSWYTKAFGAEMEQEGNRMIPSIPGTRLFFRRVDDAPAPTKGRALDHIGFDVRNVNEYCQKLAGMDITCERPMGEDTPIAMVTDPAGTRIEINQGLESR